ncbi:hypothetical protein [uncultured Campylobacter sp.]|uniref:hypothetical protein n=1 Tax=uncultured Campylobacter sp. TaxID=218934 RepID=UPI0026155293|nr:hypothetical protein [uncultured Campylobacter sp.]
MKTQNVKFSDAPSRHDETANASPVRNTQEAMLETKRFARDGGTRVYIRGILSIAASSS